MKTDCNGCKEIPRYKHRVTVQSPDGEPDASGHVDLTDDSNWKTRGVIRARFMTRGGREGRVFDQIQGEVSHLLETPSTKFSRSIHPSWRLLYGGRRFNITAGFDVDESRRTVHIHLTEVV